MTYYIVIHTKFDHRMHYLCGKPFYMCPSNVIQLQPGQEIPYNSAELYVFFCVIVRNWLKELEWYLCTEMCGIVRKSAEKFYSQKCTEMCGNQIWLRYGLTLISAEFPYRNKLISMPKFFRQKFPSVSLISAKFPCRNKLISMLKLFSAEYSLSFPHFRRISIQK